MKKPVDNSLDRRKFLMTSGTAMAGLGLPLNDFSEPDGIMDRRKSAISSKLPVVKYQVDYVVAGGGIAGVCSAITAARAGLKVVLVQDRPVLGGNASSEVRLWILGATAHMGNNNRWAREGGVHEEILVENMYRNKEGNPVIFDALLIDKVWAETNITLLLNTALYEVEMNRSNRIGKLRAFCSQNSTIYEISAPYFCDATGDGILGFLSGAEYRIGAESEEIFGEKFIMPEDFGKLLGHSMYFYSKDAGVPVKYVPPEFAMKDIPGKIPRFRDIHRDSSGCRLWWLEWGSDLDHVFESEKIKNELWKVVYGVWDYIKNSGAFEEVDNLTLEWVSTIPGKRESRRFTGDYTLIQDDIIKQAGFDDAVAYGGWSIDLHPSEGVFSSYPGCIQYHSRGIYQIPYRCIYSRNITNLFLAGRLISVSHVVFGSTRVISTGTMCGQAAALAARICLEKNLDPAEIHTKGYIVELQKDLIQSGQYIPRVESEQDHDLVKDARIIPSSVFELAELPHDGSWRRLERESGMLLPFTKGKIPVFSFSFRSEGSTTIEIKFCISQRPGNFTPDSCLAQKEYQIPSDQSDIRIDFDIFLEEPQYGFVLFGKNDKVSVAQSDIRVTGIMSVFKRGVQEQRNLLGIEEVPFYTPERRPGGKNFALKIAPVIKAFEALQLRSFVFRPDGKVTNAWVAATADKNPSLKTEWDEPQQITSVIIWLDTDFDHPMESCLMGHPENKMPFCIQKYSITDDKGQVIYETSENHHSRNEISFGRTIETSSLTVQLYRKYDNVPASLFGIQAFGPGKP